MTPNPTNKPIDAESKNMSTLNSSQPENQGQVALGRNWKHWSECNGSEKLVIIAKIAAAVLIAAALATAAVFSGFALASAIVGGSIIVSAILLGITGGLTGAAAVAVPIIANQHQLHKYKISDGYKNLEDVCLVSRQSIGIGIAGGVLGVGAGIVASCLATCGCCCVKCTENCDWESSGPKIGRYDHGFHDDPRAQHWCCEPIEAGGLGIGDTCCNQSAKKSEYGMPGKAQCWW